MKPEAGDIVKVITEDEEIEGILMPRPEILGQDVTVVKLGNGYNIGILNKKIKKIEAIEKYKLKKTEKKKLEFNKSLPIVSILSFGGTISSKVDYRTGGVHADYTAEDFVEMCPEIKRIANIRARKVTGIMSEDMNHEDWKLMAREVAKELNSDAAGVVVTQGTDTLHYSTAALSFFLENKNKPVVFTAAQRSIDRGSSDALMNLICAVTAAAKSDIAEVMVCMHGTINDDYCILVRGTKVRKMHTSRRDAFRPINEMPLAKVYDDKIEITNKNYKKRNDGKAKVNDAFENKVGLLLIHPGMNPDIMDFFIEKKYKGIVLATTALGHVPTERKNFSLLEKLKKAIGSGILVVISSQALYGRVHPYVYTNLRKLSLDLNAVFVEDMLPETAYVKLGWALGQAKDREKAKEIMLKNIAGEMTERSDAGSFLY
ncbi:Glu-tRNA(Gln) amidotransferase subunit GatD [Candidatus Woesearchaeota archaeon]|nr:Glu-tRNA(Gln) amidotransferase subunit GatD [Candidatus Woesearchaeota archaeon]